MAISSLGNITYINQNMQMTSTIHAHAMQKGDTIPKEFEERLQEVQDVRPTETNQQIHKDAKGNPQYEEKEQQSRDMQDDDHVEEGLEEEMMQEGRLLNITV